MVATLHIASRKGLFRFRKEGKEWTAGKPAFFGQPVTAVLEDKRDGAIYAALNLGHFGRKLHRSDDKGMTWKELAAPAFAPVETPSDKDPSVEMIWTLAAGGSDEPGVLWAGTIPGALFRSVDRGESWTINDAMWNQPSRENWFGGGYDHPGIHTVLVDPRDSRKVTLAISTAGVWKTADGGVTWRSTGTGMRAEYAPPEQTGNPIAQDIHRLSFCAAKPEVVWCQHHCGIFRSTDGAETFTEIKDVKPSVFGFAVAAHPSDPEVAWFVPAIKDEFRIPTDGRLVVNRAVAAGSRFEPLDNGLPAYGCYDLIYRHGLDVDPTGRQLAIGSTTGNLWISEDAGARWTLVSAHLPPIAQVAFGA